MRTKAIAGLAGWLLTLALPTPGLAGGAMEGLEGRVEELVLANGMRFLFVARGDAPVFHGMIRFEVGGVDEVPGITGLAHLFEHMAFKGTTRINTKDYEGEKLVLDEIDRVASARSRELAKWDKADKKKLEVLETQQKALEALHKKYVNGEEFTSIYTNEGGDALNATTSKDVTTYFVSLPANRLELWMLMESERLMNPVLREFYVEREVVREERRMRTDNAPAGKLYEEFVAAAYRAHPYKYPTVGWDSDIATVTMQEARAFYDAYYSPKNAVAALVGRFDIPAAKAMVQKYFGRLVNKGEIRRPSTREPPQAGERRIEVEFDASPEMLMGWHKPTIPDPDDYVFDVLGELLGTGRTARLYTRLVKTSKAQEVGVYQAPGSRYPNLFCVGVTPMEGTSRQEVETEVAAALAEIAEKGVSKAELEKVRTQVEAGFLKQLKENEGLADALTRYQIIAGDWRYMVRYLGELEKVTSERIQAVVRKYLNPHQRTVAWLTSKKKEG